MIADLGTVSAVSARIFGVFVCLPIGDALQTLPRLLLAVCLGIPLSWHLDQPASFSWYVPLSEFLIGLILASPIRIFTDAAEMLGELLDTARGQTIGSVVDPLNGQQGSDMAGVLRLGATVLVIHVGGFDRVIETVLLSYSFMPIAGQIVPEHLLRDILHRGVGIVASACSLSSVWLLAYLLSDLAAGLLTKVCHGLSFTCSASIAKMVFTILLLLNLIWHPQEVTKLAASVSEAIPTASYKADSIAEKGTGRP